MKNVERVPENANDTLIYIVSMKKGNLNHHKGKRPWGHAQSSKIKSFTAVPRFFSVAGRKATAIKSLICKN